MLTKETRTGLPDSRFFFLAFLIFILGSWLLVLASYLLPLTSNNLSIKLVHQYCHLVGNQF